MMICVINGRCPWKLLKTVWNFGMKNTSITVSTIIASTNKIAGYSIAVMTFAFNSLSRDWNSAICASTTSRNPPASPASTIAT